MTRRTSRRTRADGRPLALNVTPDIRTRLLEYIRTGVPLEHAAVAAGISSTTYFRYMQRGQEATTKAQTGAQLTPAELDLAELWEDVARARAESVTMSVLQIQKAAQGGYVLKETKRTYRDDNGRDVTEHERTYAPVDWRAAGFLLERRDRGNFGRASQLPGEGGPDISDGMGGGDVSAADVSELATRIAGFAQRALAEREARLEITAGGGTVISGEVVRGD